MTLHNKILLDVGGTFIKCSDGREIPINSNGTRDEIISSLRSAVFCTDASDSRLCKICPAEVCVAIPGPFEYATGTFRMTHKFAAVNGERFCDLVGMPEECFAFIHDVNCMLLGEMAGGAGRGYDRVALVTIGTGLGFSMSIDGEILLNELGSPKVGIYNLPYRDGVLEDYVSKRGVLRGYPEGITAKDVAGLAFLGNEAAVARFSECGAILAETIAPILKEYGIECLLLGGQISRSFSLMERSLGEGLSSVETLKYVGPVSDISNATFNGLKSLKIK